MNSPPGEGSGLAQPACPGRAQRWWRGETLVVRCGRLTRALRLVRDLLAALVRACLRVHAIELRCAVLDVPAADLRVRTTALGLGKRVRAPERATQHEPQHCRGRSENRSSVHGILLSPGE